MSAANQITMVALCRQFDIAARLGGVITARHPQIRVLRPGDVEDPEAIRHALVFRPGPEDLAPYPNLRLLCTGAAGVDGILGHPGLRPEMTVVRTISAEQAEMMTSFALYYVTGWHRQMFEYPAQQKKKLWEWRDVTPPRGFPVGILGYGNMGAKVAAALTASGYPVIAYARQARQDGAVRVVSGTEGLAEVAQAARAIINLLPLTAETMGVLDAGFFSQMPEDTILIHLGRGPHLVEADLLEGLAKGHPACAALDVFETEPLPEDSPFWTHPQVFVTPHVASLPPREEAADWIATAIAQFERGERPQGAVDRSLGY